MNFPANFPGVRGEIQLDFRPHFWDRKTPYFDLKYDEIELFRAPQALFCTYPIWTAIARLIQEFEIVFGSVLTSAIPLPEMADPEALLGAR